MNVVSEVSLQFQVQYAGPAIDISYPILYPPPPSAGNPEDTQNILIQRVPTRSVTHSVRKHLDPFNLQGNQEGQGDQDWSKSLRGRGEEGAVQEVSLRQGTGQDEGYEQVI